MFSFNYVMKGVKWVLTFYCAATIELLMAFVVAQAMLVWTLARAFIG